jgi:hypothetical protein
MPLFYWQITRRTRIEAVLFEYQQNQNRDLGGGLLLAPMQQEPPLPTGPAGRGAALLLANHKEESHHAQ